LLGLLNGKKFNIDLPNIENSRFRNSKFTLPNIENARFSNSRILPAKDRKFKIWPSIIEIHDLKIQKLEI